MTNMSPFFANYCLHHAAHFNLDSGNLEPTQQNVDATTLASNMSEIIYFFRAEISRTQ